MELQLSTVRVDELAEGILVAADGAFEKRLAHIWILARSVPCAPHETRPKVITALETLQTRREVGPRRKHGNIPL